MFDEIALICSMHFMMKEGRTVIKSYHAFSTYPKELRNRDHICNICIIIAMIPVCMSCTFNY